MHLIHLTYLIYDVSLAWHASNVLRTLILPYRKEIILSFLSKVIVFLFFSPKIGDTSGLLLTWWDEKTYNKISKKNLQHSALWSIYSLSTCTVTWLEAVARCCCCCSVLQHGIILHVTSLGEDNNPVSTECLLLSNYCKVKTLCRIIISWGPSLIIYCF